MTIQRPGGFHFLTFCDKTAFFKLADLFPECFVHRDGSPSIEPLICISDDSCPVNHNCMETLSKRIFVLFGEVLPAVRLIVLYYRKRNLSGIGGTLFWRNMKEPRNITINPFAWDNIKRRGVVYEFTPGPSFFLSGKAAEPKETVEEEAVQALD